MIRQIFICECYSIYPNFYRTAFSGERERSTDSSASDGMLINGMFKRLRMSCRWGDFDARIIGSIGTSIKEEYQKNKQKIEFRGRIQCGNILDLFDNFRCSERSVSEQVCYAIYIQPIRFGYYE